MDLRILKDFHAALDKEADKQQPAVADQLINIINSFDASKDTSFYKPFFGSLQGPTRDLYLAIRYSRDSRDQYFSIELYRPQNDQFVMYEIIRFTPKQYERVFNAIKNKAVELKVNGSGFAIAH